jgi:hypothetical protein
VILVFDFPKIKDDVGVFQLVGPESVHVGVKMFDPAFIHQRRQLSPDEGIADGTPE